MPMLPPVATTPEIDSVLQQKTVVAFGVSGGKDSIAGLIATHRYLNSIGFTGHVLPFMQTWAVWSGIKACSNARKQLKSSAGRWMSPLDRLAG